MGKAGTKGVSRAQREQQIVDVAGAVFAEGGFAGTSLNAVAARAGISKPLVYAYFGNKEGLFDACLTRAGECVAGVIDDAAALGHVGARAALLTLDRVFAVLEDRPWMWRLLREAPAAAPAEITAKFHAYQHRMRTAGAEGVRELLSAGGNHDRLDAEVMAAAWHSVFDSAIVWWLDHPEQSRAEMSARVERVLTVVFGPLEHP